MTAIVTAWLAWLALWIILAAGVKRAARAETNLSRLLHLGPLGVAILLLIGGHYTGQWLHAPLLPRAVWMAAAGAAIVAAGLAFAVWARLHLGTNWSGLVMVKQGHELVRSGPYAITRHPIYTGLLTALLGTALALDTRAALLAFALVAASFLRKLRMEEHFMQTEFRDAYARYRTEVPALVPWALGSKARGSAPGPR